MVRVTVKVHSIMEEVVGMPKFDVTVPDHSTVEDVLKYMVNHHRNGFEKKYHLQGEAWNHLKYFTLLLNGTLMNTGGLEAKVKEGDIIDIREPIAGG